MQLTLFSGAREARPGLPAVPVFGWLLLLLLLAGPAAAQINVTVQDLSTRDGNGIAKTAFLPGEEIRYQARITVFPAPAGQLTIVLRIMADGWYEVRRATVTGTGQRTVYWGGAANPLFTSAEACQGKVGLQLTAFGVEGEQVQVLGRKHGYFTIRCLSDLPSGAVVAEIPVGNRPHDMAFTADGRFLYVTSPEARIITVVDLDRPERVWVIPDWEEVRRKVEACRSQCPAGDKACLERCTQENEPLGEPTGIAPSPNGARMLVADYRRRYLHTIDAATHALMEDIPLPGIRGVNLTSLAVNPNPARNEAFVADYLGARVIRVGLSPPYDTWEIRLDQIPNFGAQPNDILFHPGLPDFLFVMSAQLIVVHRTGFPYYCYRVFYPISPWSMALNPRWSNPLDPGRFLYFVLSPGLPPQPFPAHPASVIYPWDFTASNTKPDNTVACQDRIPPGYKGPAFAAGNVMGDLVVREDGRYAYGADSYRGEILLVDLERKSELRACAIPLVSELVPSPVTARLLLRDPRRERLYVATWEPGILMIVE